LDWRERGSIFPDSSAGHAQRLCRGAQKGDPNPVEPQSDDEKVAKTEDKAKDATRIRTRARTKTKARAKTPTRKKRRKTTKKRKRRMTKRKSP